jgi:MFS family permease
MTFSALLCIVCYFLAAFSGHPIPALLGCALCGFSVGIFWPGTFSLASAYMPTGGTALFALLALGGDVGCSGGPTFVGLVSAAFGDDLRRGILCAIISVVLNPYKGD